MADELIPYVVDMGFTHIQLMPISEYPFDGSWGYQPIGMFAPSIRFGTPDELRYLIDRCHQHNIGVLVDWVPGHFPTDAHGLGKFDGSCLYEHEDVRKGFHPDWNTLIYNYGRAEVISFLLSNALYWLDEFHIDGLRVDAVASMLYLDYSRKEGEWIPNVHGGRENLEAIDFLKSVNSRVKSNYPGAVMIAEESTAWPGVSQPVEQGGLGFDYKWNMGWMNDTLAYMGRDPIYRQHHHDQMTFGLVYAFSEKFVLPLSHDEVVHGKGSLIEQMPGDDWQKFANLRAYFGFMWAHPGKKLLFMGGEFAQRSEWNHDQSLEWQLLEHGSHQGVKALVRDLNRVYKAIPALHELDCDGAGFDWIQSDNYQQSVYAWLRKGNRGESVALVVANLTPEVHRGYRVGVPQPGHYSERLNTDSEGYGGSNVGNWGGLEAESHPCNGQPCSVVITVPPLATMIFEWDGAS
jgi:1,4-alpha-glucan branching enzyme